MHGTSFECLLSKSSSGTHGNAHFKMQNSMTSSGDVCYVEFNINTGFLHDRGASTLLFLCGLGSLTT